MKISLVSLLSFSVLFLGSLRSFNFAALGGVRLLVIFSLFLLIAFITYCNLSKKNITFVIIFYLLFIANVICSLLSFKLKPHIFSYIGFVLSPLYFLLLMGFYLDRVNLLIKHLKVVLSIHLFFFYLQLMVFLVFNYVIDYLEFITHEPQRTIGGIYTEHTIIRTSGLFNEPASYSIFAVSMLLCLLFNSKKLSLLTILTIASVVLSFSASGIMFLAVLLTFIYIKKSFFFNKLYLKIGAAVAVVVGVNIYFGEERVLEILTNKLMNFQNSTSYQYRIGKIFSVFEDLNFYQKIFGTGYGNLAVNQNLGSFLSQFVVQSGVVFTVLFTFLFYINAKNYKMPLNIMAIVVVLSLSTQAFNHLITWYFLACTLVISYNKYHENNTFNFKPR